MIELVLTPDAEDYGRRRKRGYDQGGVTDAFKLAGRDKRWTGHAVEYVLHQWLTDEGIEHRWNYDGLGNKPDFVLGSDPGMRVAVKANSGDGPRDDFVFTVPEHHVNKLGDGALFAIVQVCDRKIWVAGYIDARKFRAFAKRRRRGDDGFVTGRPIEHDCRTIRADQLESAETYLGMLRRCAA